jgi:hypothetical protein
MNRKPRVYAEVVAKIEMVLIGMQRKDEKNAPQRSAKKYHRMGNSHTAMKHRSQPKHKFNFAKSALAPQPNRTDAFVARLLNMHLRTLCESKSATRVCF